MLQIIPQANNQNSEFILLNKPKEIITHIAYSISNVSDLASFSRTSKFCQELVNSLLPNNFHYNSAVHKLFLIRNLFVCESTSSPSNSEKTQTVTKSLLCKPEEDERFKTIASKPKKTEKIEKIQVLSFRRINIKMSKNTKPKKTKKKMILDYRIKSLSNNKSNVNTILGQSAQKLIQATLERGITDVENLELHCPLLREFESQLIFNPDTFRNAIIAEEDLYKKFCSHCAELAVDMNSPLFTYYLIALFTGLKNFAYSSGIDHQFPEFTGCPEYRDIKINNLITNLQLRFHSDMIHAFARQQIEFITKESCEKRLNELGIIFPDISSFNTELALSHAIDQIHGHAFYQTLTQSD